MKDDGQDIAIKIMTGVTVILIIVALAFMDFTLREIEKDYAKIQYTK